MSKKRNLHQACKFGDVKQVIYLLKNGHIQDIHVRDEDGCTPLHYACWSLFPNHHETVKILLLLSILSRERASKYYVHMRDKGGLTPLHHACWGYSPNHHETVKILLEHGCIQDIHVKDNDGYTPLHHPKDNYGRTPLHLACDSSSPNHHQTVKILLEHGSLEDIHVKDKDGNTPLHYACRSSSPNHHETVKILLEHGGIQDIHVKDEDGSTPLHYACRSSSPNHHEAVKILLEHGSLEDIHVKDKDGRTPLHYACNSSSPNHHEAVKILLEHGSLEDIHVKDKDGSTPLHYACRSSSPNHHEAVKILLEHGSLEDIHIRDKYGSTPLHYACRSSSPNHHETVKILLEHGSLEDIHIKDKDGNTPLHYACRSSSPNHHETVKILLEHSSLEDIHVKEKIFADFFKSVQQERFGGLFSSQNYFCILKLLVAHVSSKNILTSLGSAASPGLLFVRQEISGMNLFQNAIATRDRSLVQQIMHLEIKYLSHLSPSDRPSSIRTSNGLSPLELAITGSPVEYPILAMVADSLPDMSDDELNSLLSKASPTARYIISMLRSSSPSKACITNTIHLLGYGYSGKSLIVKQLKEKNILGRSSSSFRFSAISSTSSIAADARTEGLVIEKLEVGNHVRVLKDYGGQDIYHPNHMMFLACPASVYVFVVPMHDFSDTNHPELEVDIIRENYAYWLKLVASIPRDPKQSTSPRVCITVINYKYSVLNLGTSSPKIAQVMARIKSLQADYLNSSSSLSLTFVDDPVCIDVSNDGDMDKFKAIIESAERELSLEMGSYRISPCMEKVQEMLNGLRDSDQVAMKFHDFRESMKQAIRQLPTAEAITRDQSTTDLGVAVDLLSDLMIDQLKFSSDIMVVNSFDVILSPGLFSEKILGKLTKGMRMDKIASLDQRGISEDDIERHCGDVAAKVGAKVILQLLCDMGYCLPLKPTNAAAESTELLMPLLCRQNLSEEEKKSKRMKWDVTAGSPAGNRLIMHRFALREPKDEIFYPGYFACLFVRIIRKVIIDPNRSQTYNNIYVYHDAVYFEVAVANEQVQVLIERADDKKAFTVTVTSRRPHGYDVNQVYIKSHAWNIFKEIRSVIFDKQAVLPYPIDLQEYGVDVRDVTYLKELELTGDRDEDGSPSLAGLNREDIIFEYGSNGQGDLIEEESLTVSSSAQLIIRKQIEVIRFAFYYR
jgi:ankyrin repeat protein